MIIGIPNVGKSSLINALRRNYLRKGNFCNCNNLKQCDSNDIR